MQTHDTPTPERLDGRRSALREPRTCQYCGREFIPKRQTKGLFCSVRCYRLWWGQNGQREASKKGLAKLEELQATGHDPRASEQATWKRRMAFRNSALTMVADDNEDDDAFWAERGAYWQEQVEPEAEEAVFYRRRERKPLILAGHGLRLRIHRGCLVVRHGFTHYPQAAREQRLFAGDPKLPSRIILLSADGSLSLDVARWLSEQHVPLVMLDYRGHVVSVLGSETAAADFGLRRAQIEAVTNGRGLVLARSLIEQKLTASLTTLATLSPSAVKESAINRVAALLQRLRAEPPETIDDLRHLEAWAAIPYFAAWRTIELRWKGTSKRPIPPEWRRIGMRQDFLRRANHHAHHPMNALLNYGYAVLESQVRIAIATAGLDPTIGYLHVCQAGRDSFVYDLMEPHRPQVDRELLAFVRSQTFMPRDFVIDTKGVCRLHPELARQVASVVSAAVASLQLGIDTLKIIDAVVHN
ncbi:MAG: CRISPR-associated endonuclease Cas1 [Thermoleophilia bacterium]